MQALVESVIERHCSVRGWELYERAVRAKHVHVVIACAAVSPDATIAQLKACATRALRRAHLTASPAPVSAEGGSTRYLWTGAQVNQACAYVRDGQDVPR